MCGGESNIRIERAGNGYVVDSYTPGGKDRPGTHKRSVATHPGHVIKLIEGHLRKGSSAKGSERKGSGKSTKRASGKR